MFNVHSCIILFTLDIFLGQFYCIFYFQNNFSGVTFQLVDPGQVDTQMTALFANKLTWSVPSPSTYVKSTIKRIGFSSHTSGYWPHSFQNWFMSFFPRCLISKLMLKEGNNQYNHALRMKL